MRKIILYINSTFNGVVTGDPSEDKTNFMVWTTKASTKTGSESVMETLETVDTILLGRKTYEDLSRESKWPGVSNWPGVDDLALKLGEKINNAHKLIVTNTLSPDELKWGDFEAPRPLAVDDLEEQVRDLKNSEGGDIIIFGSPTLVRSLAEADLIDVYQILLHPVLVNVGEHLFDSLSERKELHLVDAKPLEDGSILATYNPRQGLAWV